jgi:hypothetical protein
MCQDPTAKVLLELLNDEVRQWVAGVGNDLFFEGEPVVLDKLIEGRLFGNMADVGGLA